MATQKLFDFTPRDPNVLPADCLRLAAQSEKILTMLRTRPRTNVELMAVACKYTSRISDLRAIGYRIRCDRGEGGLTTYTLEGRDR